LWELAAHVLVWTSEKLRQKLLAALRHGPAVLKGTLLHVNAGHSTTLGNVVVVIGGAVVVARQSIVLAGHTPLPPGA